MHVHGAGTFVGEFRAAIVWAETSELSRAADDKPHRRAPREILNIHALRFRRRERALRERRRRARTDIAGVSPRQGINASMGRYRGGREWYAIPASTDARRRRTSEHPG